MKSHLTENSIKQNSMQNVINIIVTVIIYFLIFLTRYSFYS